VGDVAMTLIICTETQPLQAVRQLYSRVGLILFPFSIVLIRYTTLGRAWDQGGNMSIVGVTDNKNMLGLIVFLISVGVLWNFRRLLMNRSEPNRRRRLVAQGTLLACGLYLLSIAHSSTSMACFLLGSGLMLTTHLPAMRRRPSRLYLLSFLILAAGALAIVFGGSEGVANALGGIPLFPGEPSSGVR